MKESKGEKKYGFSDFLFEKNDKNADEFSQNLENDGEFVIKGLSEEKETGKDALYSDVSENGLTEEKKRLSSEEKRAIRREKLIKKYETELERKKNKEKRSFKDIISLIFPVKGDSVPDIIRKSILIVSACTFIVSAVLLLNYGMESVQNNKITDSVKELKGQEIDLSNIDFPSGANAKDFGALYAANPDTVGWIYIPNTGIDNVVCQSDDNEFYREHDFYKKSSEHGTIMLDCDADISFASHSKNLVLYGHHMRDGSMFASLKKYRTFSFYQENPIIYFDTLYDKGQYEIFSVMITNDEREEDNGYRFNFNQVNFSTESEFTEFIKQIRRRSLYNTNVVVSSDDQILTLSTCVYDFNEARLVICARKLRAGEEAADTSSATRNSKVLYPQAWYKKYGGSKPVFEDDASSGQSNPSASTPDISSTSASESASAVSATASFASLPSIPSATDLTPSEQKPTESQPSSQQTSTEPSVSSETPAESTEQKPAESTEQSPTESKEQKPPEQN